MVRVWTPGGDEPTQGLRGTAGHISTGTNITFTDAQQLIAFLNQTIAAGDRHRAPLMPSAAPESEQAP